jgi:hypothetical protein
MSKVNQDRRCLICKYLTEKQYKIESIRTSYFFTGRKRWISVSLCKDHERELFVHGQYKFIKQYKSIGQNFVVYDADYKKLNELFKALERYEEAQRDLTFRRISSPDF